MYDLQLYLSLETADELAARAQKLLSFPNHRSITLIERYRRNDALDDMSVYPNLTLDEGWENPVSYRREGEWAHFSVRLTGAHHWGFSTQIATAAEARRRFQEEGVGGRPATMLRLEGWGEGPGKADFLEKTTWNEHGVCFTSRLVFSHFPRP